MPQFHFRLATLLRLRERQRDERQNQLAEALRAEQLLDAQRAEIAQELHDLVHARRDEQLRGHVNVDNLLVGQRYELLLRAQQAQFLEQSRQLATEIGRRREALVDANREVKILEKLREQQQVAWNDEQNRREIAVLDEVAGRTPRAEEASPWEA